MQPVQHIDATRDYKQLMAKATQLWLDKNWRRPLSSWL